jgi:hypothetical protein
MSAGFKRRDIIKSGLIGAATLALPARALADPLAEAFDKTFTGPTAPAAPVTPPITIPAMPEPNPAYERRVLEIARREVARSGNAVWRKDIAGIADFARPSSLPRFHFANLENGTVRSFLVAHGKGSDPEHSGWLQSFSNMPGSEATSRGGYLTCEWYNGKYGTSIRLVGLDNDNSLALDRAIVVHPAWYVDPAMISKWGKIGRSEGCFAMSPADFNEALWHLSGGRLLYADRITLT